MSFVGYIGTLVKNSGVKEILSEVLGVVAKRLSGKVPKNVCALRMLT
jgi:hypothetical protein